MHKGGPVGDFLRDTEYHIIEKESEKTTQKQAHLCNYF